MNDQIRKNAGTPAPVLFPCMLKRCIIICFGWERGILYAVLLMDRWLHWGEDLFFFLFTLYHLSRSTRLALYLVEFASASFLGHFPRVENSLLQDLGVEGSIVNRSWFMAYDGNFPSFIEEEWFSLCLSRLGILGPEELPQKYFKSMQTVLVNSC